MQCIGHRGGFGRVRVRPEEKSSIDRLFYFGRLTDFADRVHHDPEYRRVLRTVFPHVCTFPLQSNAFSVFCQQANYTGIGGEELIISSSTDVFAGQFGAQSASVQLRIARSTPPQVYWMSLVLEGVTSRRQVDDSVDASFSRMPPRSLQRLPRRTPIEYGFPCVPELERVIDRYRSIRDSLPH